MSDSTTNAPLKRCTSCGNEYPASTDYFYKAKGGRHGVSSKCKNCVALSKGLKGTRYWPPQMAPQNHKICVKCKQVLPLVDFHKSNFTKDGYKSQCKNCRRAYAGYNKRPVYDVPGGMKRCTWCGENKPVTPEYFCANLDKTKLKPFCRECFRIHKRLKREIASHFRQVANAVPEGMKRCSQCGAVKPATVGFFYRKNGRLIAACKECHNQRTRMYVQKHLDHVRKRRANWADKHREQIRDSQKRWENKNREKNRETRRAQARERRKQYPEKDRLTIQKRLARKRGLPDTLTTTEWQDALDYFGGCCAACGRPPGLWHTLAMDHWIPLSDTEHCPGTVATNIVPLCHSQKDGAEGCNNSKCAHDPVEWLTSRFGARKAKRILARIQAYFDSLEEG